MNPLIAIFKAIYLIRDSFTNCKGKIKFFFILISIYLKDVICHHYDLLLFNEVRKRNSMASINSFDYSDPIDNSTLDHTNDGFSSETCSVEELLKKFVFVF